MPKGMTLQELQQLEDLMHKFLCTLSDEASASIQRCSSFNLAVKIQQVTDEQRVMVAAVYRQIHAKRMQLESLQKQKDSHSHTG